MEKILPLEHPIIDGLAGYSIVQSIILQNVSGVNWFQQQYLMFCCSMRIQNNVPKLEANFINSPKLRQYNNYEFLPQQIYCPLLSSYEFDPEYIYQTTSILDFIKSYIDKDKYVCVYLDRKYIPQYQVDTSYPHVALIYGYSDGQQCVYVADYLKKYDCFQVAYPLISRAFESAVHLSRTPNLSYNIDSNQFIHYHKTVILYSNNEPYQFDLRAFKNTLSAYCDSVMPTVNNNPLFLKYFNDKWGISAYDAYTELLKYMIANDIVTPIDIRQFHLLYEHKHALQVKLAYLKETGTISGLNIADAETLVKQTSIVRSIIIKYNITYNPALLEKAKNILTTAQANERQLLGAVLKELN